MLKFPAGTEKKDYEFWEANTRQAWPIKFESEEKVLGLDTYKFVQEVPTTKIAEIAGVPRSALKLPGEGSVTVTATTRRRTSGGAAHRRHHQRVGQAVLDAEVRGRRG